MEFGEGESPHVIEKTLVERDLGLIISKDLKQASKIDKATKSAKAIIGPSFFDLE